MQERLLQWLACPACGEADLTLKSTRREPRKVWRGHWEPEEQVSGLRDGMIDDIVGGTIACPACGAVYPIVDGVPRMNPPGTPDGPSTAHALTQFERAVPEFEENFRDLLQPLQPDVLMGKLTLDAGCGFGRHAFFAARYGAEVIAMDSSSEAVASAANNLRDHIRAHVVQGDLARPPLRRGIFDFAYSFGVLHHVPDARATFSMLTELLRSGGRLSIWTYGPRQGTIRMVTGALRGATAEMSSEQLASVSKSIASGLRLFSHTPYRLFGAVPGFRWGLKHLPVHDHHRWPFDVVVADVYDRLRIPITGYHTGEEVERWYAEAGYADIHVTRRVRNTESFRGTGTKR
jgi:SAM-dependent methyltransferase/uncharacterized protein YbaR (Trm112 family)